MAPVVFRSARCMIRSRMPPEARYEDQLVPLTDEDLTLKNYYFPLGTPKRIPATEIVSIEKTAPTLLNGKWRLWGSSNFVSWFPLDGQRPRRGFMYRLRRHERQITICFTVENSTAFDSALPSKWWRR